VDQSQEETGPSDQSELSRLRKEGFSDQILHQTISDTVRKKVMLYYEKIKLFFDLGCMLAYCTSKQN